MIPQSSKPGMQRSLAQSARIISKRLGYHSSRGALSRITTWKQRKGLWWLTKLLHENFRRKKVSLVLACVIAQDLWETNAGAIANKLRELLRDHPERYEHVARLDVKLRTDHDAFRGVVLEFYRPTVRNPQREPLREIPMLNLRDPVRAAAP